MTYGELDGLVSSIATSLRALRLESSVVGLVEEDGGNALVLLLGALEAGCQVAILDPGESADGLARWIEQSGAAAILTWSKPGLAPELPVRVVRWEEMPMPRVRAGPGRLGRPAPPRKPAVMLPSKAGLVVHSHFSLAAMAVAITNFMPKLRALDFLAHRPLCEWETLTGVLGALLSGRAAGFGHPDAGILDPHEAYAVIPRPDADAIAASGSDPGGWGRLRYVFVLVGPFSLKWRRGLEVALGRAVLPMWGSAEVGPAVAAHPTWYPVAAHGIPIVNVSLVPINPATGRPSEVPWAMLNRAQLGIDSPSTMVAIAGRDDAEFRVGDVVRTSAVVEIDSVGVVRFFA